MKLPASLRATRPCTFQNTQLSLSIFRIHASEHGCHARTYVRNYHPFLSWRAISLPVQPSSLAHLDPPTCFVRFSLACAEPGCCLDPAYRSKMASQQRALLLGLLDMPLPASLYVSDFNSPDYVSSFVDDVLETHSTRAKHTRVVSVSPQSAPTIPLLAARVLRQLGASKAYDPRLDAARFVARLGPLVTSEKPLILRIDHAERIRDSWPSDFLEILLRLDELVRICPAPNLF